MYHFEWLTLIDVDYSASYIFLQYIISNWLRLDTKGESFAAFFEEESIYLSQDLWNTHTYMQKAAEYTHTFARSSTGEFGFCIFPNPVVLPPRAARSIGQPQQQRTGTKSKHSPDPDLCEPGENMQTSRRKTRELAPLSTNRRQANIWS